MIGPREPALRRIVPALFETLYALNQRLQYNLKLCRCFMVNFLHRYQGAPPVFVRLGAVTLLLAFLSGCGRDEVQVYRLAKEPTAPPAPAIDPHGAMSSMPGAGHGAALPGLKYAVPAGWEEAPPGEIRAASFRISRNGQQADLGVVPLPGLMGHDLENVNRWRGTVGLPPIDEAELKKQTEPVEMDGGLAAVYDLAGENPGSGDKTRILAAVLRREGVAWFFKMNGDDDLVAAEKPAFLQFLKSVRFTAPTGVMPAITSGELPPSHPPIDGRTTAPMAAASDSPKPSWQVPVGWREVAGGPFLISKFNLEGGGETQAAVNVSMSAGDGGGFAANVNRWRKQLGLDELPEAQIATSARAIDTRAGKAELVDLSGTDARTGHKTRLIAAVVPQEGRTWFYKLMGDEQLVGREQQAFIGFVQSVQY